MKKNLKKIIGVMAAFAIVASMPVTAFAGSNSKHVNGYGTLYGSVNSSGHYRTTVSTNTDNAYLTISGTVQNRNGQTIYRQSTVKSSRGSKSLRGYYNRIPSGAHAIYGAHGVQGGRNFGSAAVYTYTLA